jgi:hypothetical protein
MFEKATDGNCLNMKTIKEHIVVRLSFALVILGTLIGICFIDAPRFRENWFSTAFIYRRFYAFFGAEQGFFCLFAPARRCCPLLPAGRLIAAGFPAQNRQAVAAPRHTHRRSAGGVFSFGALGWISR